MLASQELKKLAERKQLLLLEVELHRSIIGLECENLRARLVPLNEARESIATGGPWLAAGSAIAGLLAVRHWRKVIRWAPLAVSALRWLKKIRAG